MLYCDLQDNSKLGTILIEGFGDSGIFALEKRHFLLAMGQSFALVSLVCLLGTSPSWNLEIQSPRIERDDPASTLLAWK